MHFRDYLLAGELQWQERNDLMCRGETVIEILYHKLREMDRNVVRSWTMICETSHLTQ